MRVIIYQMVIEITMKVIFMYKVIGNESAREINENDFTVIFLRLPAHVLRYTMTFTVSLFIKFFSHLFIIKFKHFSIFLFD